MAIGVLSEGNLPVFRSAVAIPVFGWIECGIPEEVRRENIGPLSSMAVVMSPVGMVLGVHEQT
jgi:hypothetical protein